MGALWSSMDFFELAAVAKRAQRAYSRALWSRAGSRALAELARETAIFRALRARGISDDSEESSEIHELLAHIS